MQALGERHAPINHASHVNGFSPKTTSDVSTPLTHYNNAVYPSPTSQYDKSCFFSRSITFVLIAAPSKFEAVSLLLQHCHLPFRLHSTHKRTALPSTEYEVSMKTSAVIVRCDQCDNVSLWRTRVIITLMSFQIVPIFFLLFTVPDPNCTRTQT